ncbi:hypothetical protein AAE026_37540 [Bradyrhizobium sp. DN5]|uniref:hypothetical protein n=1 Tax=unclassified Bradyrhizobium TaxID=2631580 RepID=UPI0008922B7E|nr:MULTISPECIES: hypothetical protein [unclassified Bradyrhizobium]UQR67621.1 hypothetical protein LRP30_21255 [Bradyrhizobium sp. C-145]SDJ59077.1 hypothetical protein SAMN05216338_105557 [Bradyrhizobium sp. Rc2d]
MSEVIQLKLKSPRSADDSIEIIATRYPDLADAMVHFARIKSLSKEMLIVALNQLDDAARSTRERATSSSETSALHQLGMFLSILAQLRTTINRL